MSATQTTCATYVERTGNIMVHHPVKPRPTPTGSKK